MNNEEIIKSVLRGVPFEKDLKGLITVKGDFGPLLTKEEVENLNLKFDDVNLVYSSIKSIDGIIKLSIKDLNVNFIKTDDSLFQNLIIQQEKKKKEKPTSDKKNYNPNIILFIIGILGVIFTIIYILTMK
ncbi:MAG: hypothetical protein KDK90_26365 [Leptospiraceae bacterium]|nr:hypothetical protein [Leptospiraceae bacterium]